MSSPLCCPSFQPQPPSSSSVEWSRLAREEEILSNREERPLSASTSLTIESSQILSSSAQVVDFYTVMEKPPSIPLQEVKNFQSCAKIVGLNSSQEQQQYVFLSKISKQTQISNPFLTKVLQKSFRGKKSSPTSFQTR